MWCFVPGVLEAIGQLPECSWVDVTLVPDLDDLRYEVAVVTGCTLEGDTHERRIKEARDGRPRARRS